jgi:hypothetical protein
MACSNEYNLVGIIISGIYSEKWFLIIKKEAVKPLLKLLFEIYSISKD